VLKSTVSVVEFGNVAPAGHYLALRVGFAFPLEERNCLPVAWVTEYTRRGFLLSDPVIRWLYQNRGVARWSEIDLPDPAGVMQSAAGRGLRFGAAVSVTTRDDGGARSFGTFARSDRELTDVELGLLADEVRRLHIAKAPPSNLTDAELEALGMVKNGLLLKEIAARLGVTEGAVQQRLKNAKLKLNAATSSQAVSMAASYGLI
jgi:LuxR family transcriptional regulator